MYEMMTGKIFQTFRNQHCLQSGFISTAPNPTNGAFWTYGRDIIDRPYSKRLIDLTHRCLAKHARIRPPCREILREAEFMLNNAYTPLGRPVVKSMLDTPIANHNPNNHAALTRMTNAQRAAVLPLMIDDTTKLPGAAVPFWPVAPHGPVAGLPPFAADPALNYNAWPWNATVQGDPPLGNPERASRAVDREYDRFLRWKSGQ